MDDDKLFDEEAERPRFKITDRRKFASDGTLLDPDAAAAPASTAAAPPAPDTGAEPETPDTGAEPETPGTGTEAGTPGSGAEAAPPGTDTEPGAETNVTDDPTASSETARPADGAPRIATPDASIAELPRDFAAFVEGMYLEAMLYMGAIPDPRSGETVEDTELAKYKIDLLAMLQKKTDGNLTPEETKQLDEVLYQLRMVYVQKTRPIEP